MVQLRLRRPEWILIGFFAYIVLLSPFFPERPQLGIQPLFTLLAVLACFWVLSRLAQGAWTKGIEIARDWLPLLFTLIAFREMELFVTRDYNMANEMAWIRLDRLLLTQWNLSAAIESVGKLLPLYLEFCYLLVYGIGAFCLVLVMTDGAPSSKTGHRAIDRDALDLFWTVYLLGTLAAYALFPFFPSQPPRYAFPDVAPPIVVTWARHLNLWILGKATIHSGVFPSAHVSSAFSCAWAMFFIRPQRPVLGVALLLYAISVSVATIYGRYHYAADVLAGFAVSVAAAGVVYGVRAYAQHKELKTTTKATIKGA